MLRFMSCSPSVRKHLPTVSRYRPVVVQYHLPNQAGQNIRVCIKAFCGVTSDRLQRLARKCVGSGGTLIVRENRGGSRLTERQRLYRVKRDADPTKRVEYLKKKDKYKADLESRKRKTVGNMNPRENRQQRRKWRSRQRLCRQKRKKFMLAVSDENGVSSSLHASTPITM